VSYRNNNSNNMASNTASTEHSTTVAEIEQFAAAVRDLDSRGKKLRRDFNACYSDQDALVKELAKVRKTCTQLSKTIKRMWCTRIK
jgi:outer membrane murein-binding lipoprotein Lpp